jgi:hypothetical protein
VILARLGRLHHPMITRITADATAETTTEQEATTEATTEQEAMEAIGAKATEAEVTTAQAEATRQQEATTKCTTPTFSIFRCMPL